MKSFEFSEEELGNLEQVAEVQMYDENDPRSIFYKRELVRPKPKWLLIILFLVVQVGLSICLALALNHFGVSSLIRVLSILSLNLIYLLIFAKQIVVTCVKLYQYLAPASIRQRCRFEPSCSEYMLLAIEKYGLLKGVSKGLNRIKRCRNNDGGYDMP